MKNKKRKTIGVITTDPENIYQSKVLDGIFRKGAELNYDVLVFSTFVKATHTDTQYLLGEANIYNAINFDLLDGVIVITLSFKYHSENLIYDQITSLLRNKCKCPVVTIDETIDEYDCVSTDDIVAFEKITDHLIDVHNCRNLYILAGERGVQASKDRIRGVKNSLRSHGMSIEESCIFYGEFWYSFGKRIAERMITGDIKLPDAVICGSDYIGLGFLTELSKNGIRVPEDIIVTGYDGVIESKVNEITLTSYIPPIAETGQIAMIRLAEKIELHEISSKLNPAGKLVCGMSCGCKDTHSYIREKSDYGYLAGPASQEIDMGKFLESYMEEHLTESADLDECYSKIKNKAYLINDCVEYFMCTCDKWEDISEGNSDLYGNKCGYPEKMKISVYRCTNEIYEEWENGFQVPSPYLNTYFSTSEMLPVIFSTKRKEPAVFYFTPVHFNGRRIGYSVLRFAPEKAVVNYIYNMWSRYVNNALEMMRVRKLLLAKSVRDTMTGLFNRNSLQNHINDQYERSVRNSDEMYVQFIDMNSLKYINDKYGHEAGDSAIITLSGIISSVCIDGSVCIRMGGDEFLIIGHDKNCLTELTSKTERIIKRLDTYNNVSENPYKVTASFGYSIRKPDSVSEIDDMIREADAKMYEYKTEFKKQNKIN